MDETTSLTDETSSLTDEATSLMEEGVASPDAPTGLWSRFLSAAACGWKKFLSTWNSNPWQMRLVLISLLLYMADVITDIMLAKQYYSNGDYHWFGWTIGFVVAPPAVMNFMLLVYDIDLLDIKLSLRKWEKCLLNFTCFAPPLIKYVEFINLLDGGKDVKESLKKKLHRFHLVEAILESLPQLCLQLYIIFTTHEQVSVLKVISMVISLLAAVKAVVTCMYYDRRSTYMGPATQLWSRFLSAWNSNPEQMRLVLVSLLLYILYMADVITDIMLAVQYYNNGDYHWFGCTLGFVMAPPAVRNILLLVFDIDLLDIKLSLRKWEKCLLNLTCFAPPLIKYVEVINLLDGGKDVKESLKKKLHCWHLFEATFESLPQLCLHIYINETTHEQESVLKFISMMISLLAAAEAVATYMYYDRHLSYEESGLPIDLSSLFSFSGLKMIELSYRVLAIGMFASVYKQWVLLPIGLHWLVMAFCVVIDIHRTGNKDVTEACLHLAICIFITTIPKGKGYWGVLFVNLALTCLSNIVMYFCVDLGWLPIFLFFCTYIGLIFIRMSRMFSYVF